MRVNVASVMLRAMTHEGNRLAQAWYSFVATYCYTRAHDGSVVGPDPEDVIYFSRWYCFHSAIGVAWRHFWEKP